jgi:hypothetical protein
MNADDLAQAFDGNRPQRSGSLRVQSIEGEVYRQLLGIVPAPTVARTFEMTFTTRVKTPKPVPWRQPLRWLRWNPLLTEEITLHFPSVSVEFEP